MFKPDLSEEDKEQLLSLSKSVMLLYIFYFKLLSENQQLLEASNDWAVSFHSIFALMAAVACFKVLVSVVHVGILPEAKKLFQHA